MEYEFIKVEQQGDVAVITLNRPKVLNALNGGIYHELIHSLEAIDAEGSAKVVIVTGAGDKAFAAGADIAQMVEQDAIEGRRFSALCHRALNLLENIRQVTIAAVNGYALGGGCELTLACDIRIAAENARFALPEVTLGIIPGAGGTQRLARLIGLGRAKEMIFTGDQIDAQEAYRMGLANHVVPQAELMDHCMALANKIASRGSFAVSMAKNSINGSANTDLTSGGQREMDLMALTFATHDKEEGMKAFLERRKPDFKDF